MNRMKIIKAKELKKGDKFRLLKPEEERLYTHLGEYKRSLFYIYITDQIECGLCVGYGLMRLRKNQKVSLEDCQSMEDCQTKAVEKPVAKIEGLEITGARLLSVEEAKELSKQIMAYRDWWWLRSPGCDFDYVACVNKDGFVEPSGTYAYSMNVVVRPTLKIKNLASSNLKVGDDFIFGDKKFKVISKTLAFCLEDIGSHYFGSDYGAEDSNNYEKSDVKKFVDKWFEDVCKNQK